MISSIFQMTIGHHVEFLKAQNFIYWGVWSPRHVTMPNFVEIGPPIMEIL